MQYQTSGFGLAGGRAHHMPPTDRCTVDRVELVDRTCSDLTKHIPEHSEVCCGWRCT
jgi:hypothetical protein